MTTTPDAPIRRKLIEVSIPLEDINAESAREKSIRHGHPSTLHLWVGTPAACRCASRALRRNSWTTPPRTPI